MKQILVLLIVAVFGQISLADQPSKCGEVWGPAWNQDTIERPYSLSGFWVEQGQRSTPDIRITYGNSPELIEVVQELEGIHDGSVFVCMDEYVIERRTYAKRPRLYGLVTKFRVWVDGERIH